MIDRSRIDVASFSRDLPNRHKYLITLDLMRRVCQYESMPSKTLISDDFIMIIKMWLDKKNKKNNLLLEIRAKESRAGRARSIITPTHPHTPLYAFLLKRSQSERKQLIISRGKLYGKYCCKSGRRRSFFFPLKHTTAVPQREWGK